MIEVLAPAGSFSAVVAAIRAGADAVYFGAPGFNARRNAKNLSFDEIGEAVRFARLRGVKTYLTLNTLVSDGELESALQVAQTAAELGVDALIVQDIGLASLLKKHLPNMPLHASTQMSVHSADALPLLYTLGFTRVVPAREMDKDALSELCRAAKKLGIEVEVFIHGALCMCLSGQCYLSAMLGGRSGNRGLCAQPCRLEFSANGGTGHDLSLKDLSLVKYIGELTEMGVSSFKIEGRMKREEYVAAATAVCKAAANNEEIPLKAEQVLSGIFSRSGHTDGYYKNELGRDMFGIRTDADLKRSEELIGATHELFRRERQSVSLKGRFVLKKDTLALLEITDSDGNFVSVTGPVPEAAVSVAVTEQVLKEKLLKCGGTVYYFDLLEMSVEDGIYFGAGNIGAMRREAFSKMDELRMSYDGKYAKGSTLKQFKISKRNSYSKEIKTVARFRSADQIPDNLDGIYAVALSVESDFSALRLPKGVGLIAEVPRGVMHRGEYIIQRLNLAKQNGAVAAFCGNLASFEYAKKAGLVPIADFGMNIFNSESVVAAEEIGAKACVLSFELCKEQIDFIGGNIPKGVITYGRLPLMLTRNCPAKNGGTCATCGGKGVLTDRLKVEFPVLCRGEFSEVYNSRVLWMLDRKDELSSADFELLYFTDEDKQRVAEVILSAKAKKAPDCEFTRGLYYREVF